MRGKNIPWGISESGFYAFDPQLNYQYKAHGVQKLGLKRGLNDDLVISPYSTFLLLPFEPEAALKNFDELEQMQMTGRCGFYEAADFSPERVDGQEYALVRSYMAHHVGMSMVSVCNALKGYAMQNRFMRDDRMAAARCLLEEKIPTGASVFSRCGAARNAATRSACHIGYQGDHGAEPRAAADAFAHQRGVERGRERLRHLRLSLSRIGYYLARRRFTA